MPQTAATAPDPESGWVELLGRIAADDQAALAELYDATAAIVYGVALRVLGDAGAAEDVAAETYLQVWRSADRFDAARGRPSTWLRTLARSRAIDRLRAERRERQGREELVRELTALDLTGAPDPSLTVDADQRRRAARVALASLPREQREVLLLAYFSGLSQREIATRLGEPLGTVKSRARLGLSKLRELLGGEDA